MGNDEAERRRIRARDRQRKVRTKRREAAAAMAGVPGGRFYPHKCETCGEPMRTAGGLRRHVEAIHP